MNLSNFASLFPFRTLGGSQSSINTLLDSKDITIQKLLDEESFSSEFKSQNPKLMQYLKYDKYKNLIEYITIVGPEDDNKRSCKFPFVVAQVLTTDNNTFIDYLLPEKQLFVEQDHIEQVEVEEEVDVQQQKPQSQPSGDDISVLESSDENKKTETKQTLQNESNKDEDENTKDSQEYSTKQNITVQSEEQEEGELKQIEAQLIQQKQKQLVVKKEKRKVKKQVVTKVKKQVDPLIGDLFFYLDEELNYVLAGYFSKIVTSVFGRKPISLTKYIFEQGQYLKLLKHIGSRSIAQLISKIVTLDTCNYLQQRQQILTQLLKLLQQPSGQDINVIINVSFVLCDVIQKSASGVKTNLGSKQLLTHIYSSTFCSGLLNNIVSQVQQIAIYSSPILLTALTSIKQLSQNKQQCKNMQLVQKYSQLMASLKFNLAESSDLSVIFKNFLIKAVDRLDYQKSRSLTLGLGRIKLIQALFYLLKFDLFSLKITIPQTTYFEKLFELMKQYHMNNVLHNQVVKTISFVLETDQGASLLPCLFSNGKFIDFLFQETEIDMNIQEQISNGKKGITRKGYIGHIVKIGQIIQKLQSNKTLPEVDQSKWQTIKSLIATEVTQTEKTLAGYSAKRGEQTSNIMFSRQQILSYHRNFLSKPPVITYPPVQQSNQDQLDLVMQQFDQKLNIDTEKTVQQKYNKDEDQTHQKHMKTSQQIQQQKVIQDQREKQQQQGLSLVGYWKNSKKMNYDIEDIMRDVN